METYTWEVLPESLRTGDVVDQVVQEYKCTLDEMKVRDWSKDYLWLFAGVCGVVGHFAGFGLGLLQSCCLLGRMACVCGVDRRQYCGFRPLGDLVWVWCGVRGGRVLCGRGDAGLRGS